MASSHHRIFAACLVLLLALVAAAAAHVAESRPAAEGAAVGSSSVPKIDCGAACAGRCRLSSRHNMCMRACGTCCYRCGCVPPGTYGNKEMCPCYARMTTHGGRPKCP